MSCGDIVHVVAANHENDRCFGNGRVMGSADCINYAGLVKTPEKLFKCKLGLCQTHCRHVPVFSFLSKYHVIMWSKSANRSRRHSFVDRKWGHGVCSIYALHTYHTPSSCQYGLHFDYLVSGPLPLRSHKDRSSSRGHFWESLVFRLHSKLARSILALKLSVTTTDMLSNHVLMYSCD